MVILEKVMQLLSFITMLIVDISIGTLIYYCIKGKEFTKKELAFMIGLSIGLLYITYGSLNVLIS